MVVSGFAELPAGRGAVPRIRLAGEPGAGTSRQGAWLTALAGGGADHRQPTARTSAPRRSPSPGRACSRWGLPARRWPLSRAPFREGMFQEDRLRRLGDRIDGEWQQTVIDGGPRGAPTPQRGERPGRAPDGPPGRQVTTPLTVHALLLLYDKDEADADDWAAAVGTALKPHGVSRPPLAARPARSTRTASAASISASPTALSQPIPFDADGEKVSRHSATAATSARPVHGVPLGEFLIGHTTPITRRRPGPVVPGRLPMARTGGSDRTDGARGLPTISGSTAATWWCASSSSMSPRSGNSLDGNAERIRARDPSIRPMSPPTGWPSASSAATVTATCSARRACCGREYD